MSFCNFFVFRFFFQFSVSRFEKISTFWYLVFIVFFCETSPHVLRLLHIISYRSLHVCKHFYVFSFFIFTDTFFFAFFRFIFLRFSHVSSSRFFFFSNPYLFQLGLERMVNVPQQKPSVKGHSLEWAVLAEVILTCFPLAFSQVFFWVWKKTILRNGKMEMDAKFALEVREARRKAGKQDKIRQSRTNKDSTRFCWKNEQDVHDISHDIHAIYCMIYACGHMHTCTVSSNACKTNVGQTGPTGQTSPKNKKIDL